MNLVFASVMGQAYGDPVAVWGQVLEVDGGVFVVDQGIRSQDDVVGRFYTPSIERRCRRFGEHGEVAEIVGSADSEGQAGLAQARDSNLGVAGKDLVDVLWVVWEGTDFDAIHGAQSLLRLSSNSKLGDIGIAEELGSQRDQQSVDAALTRQAQISRSAFQSSP